MVDAASVRCGHLPAASPRRDPLGRDVVWPASCRDRAGPPRHLRVTVEGRTASFFWTNVGAASGFMLEIGTAPGRTDLAVGVGVESTVSFTGVPPGTYYVRVRGGNEFGGGRPSAEVRVDVP